MASEKGQATSIPNRKFFIFSSLNNKGEKVLHSKRPQTSNATEYSLLGAYYRDRKPMK